MRCLAVVSILHSTALTEAISYGYTPLEEVRGQRHAKLELLANGQSVEEDPMPDVGAKKTRHSALHPDRKSFPPSLGTRCLPRTMM